VPKEWWPQVNRWLKKMGYRFVLRKFTYPATVQPGGTLEFTSWWENKGVAPCYRPFRMALRLKSDTDHFIVPIETNLRDWLPGDNLCDRAVVVPTGVPKGQYDLEIGILDPTADLATVKLAIAGRTPDGWYRMGTIEVK
jgi:hypothetical protein